MGDHPVKHMPDNICCIGASQVGLLVSAIAAHACPTLTATVVDTNPEKIMLWNTQQVSFNSPKLEEILKISQNRNLNFTTDTVSAIKAAEIIFISLDLSTTEASNKPIKILDFSEIESVIRLIAKVSENEKIIVVKNTVPVGTKEVLKRILDANKTNAEFIIISFPELACPIDPVSSYLKQSKILLGCDSTSKAILATEKLRCLFKRTSPPKVVRVSNRSAELGKICDSAFKAQKISNMNALAIISEELGADSSEICKVLGNRSEAYLELTGPNLKFSSSHLKKHLTYLVELCEDLNLYESAEYWRQVLLMNEYQEKRFMKKILSAFFNNLSRKRLAIWGSECIKDIENACEPWEVGLGQNLVLEGAKLNVYEPKKVGRQMMNEFKAEAMVDQKDVTYYEDPYKAANKADAIILLSKLENLNDLDFNKIYENMEKPAHFFDGTSCFPEEELIKVGFHVEAIGKIIQQPQSFDYIN